MVGALIAGIVVGIFARPELPELLRWAFFYLFLFSIGYSVGPQFFGSLKKAALPQIALALVAVTGLATVIGAAALLRFDEGIAVGLLSGGMTQSAALGTGLNAIAELDLPAAEKAALSANAPLADAITYGFGDLGLILFLTWLGPKVMRADLRKEARRMEEELSSGKPHGQGFFNPQYSLRAHRVEAAAAGLTLEALEERYAEERLSVQRIQRGGELIDSAPGLKLQPDDVLVIVARRGVMLAMEREIGPELHDGELLAVPTKVASVVVTNREAMVAFASYSHRARRRLYPSPDLKRCLGKLSYIIYSSPSKLGITAGMNRGQCQKQFTPAPYRSGWQTNSHPTAPITLPNPQKSCGITACSPVWPVWSPARLLPSLLL